MRVDRILIIGFVDDINLFIIIIYSYCIELTVAMAEASTILQYSFD